MKDIAVKIILCDKDGKELEITKDVYGSPLLITSLITQINNDYHTLPKVELNLKTQTLDFNFNLTHQKAKEILDFIGVQYG